MNVWILFRLCRGYKTATKTVWTSIYAQLSSSESQEPSALILRLELYATAQRIIDPENWNFYQRIINDLLSS